MAAKVEHYSPTNPPPEGWSPFNGDDRDPQNAPMGPADPIIIWSRGMKRGNNENKLTKEYFNSVVEYIKTHDGKEPLMGGVFPVEDTADLSTYDPSAA